MKDFSVETRKKYRLKVGNVNMIVVPLKMSIFNQPEEVSRESCNQQLIANVFCILEHEI